MSLFTTASDANLDESAAVWTRYTRTRQSEDKSESDGPTISIPYYEYHRITSGSYRYVGMTKTAALETAARLRDILEHRTLSQRLEFYGVSVVIMDQGFSSVFGGDIAIQRDGGEMWSVSVSLNEDITLFDRNEHGTQSAMEVFFNGKLGCNTWSYQL